MRFIRTSVSCAFLSLGLINANAQAITIDSLTTQSIVSVFDSPLGYVEGYLKEEEARPLREVTRSIQPIQIRVTLIHRYRQEDCGRIQIDMAQRQVPDKNMQVNDVVLPPIQLNICADGDPPQDTAEVREVTNKAQKEAKSVLNGF